MSSEPDEHPKKHYSVEAGQRASSASERSLQQANAAKLDRSNEVEPLPLEPEGPPNERAPASPDPSAAAGETASSVKALDVCPNCGASMRNTNALVCLRCGFDLKTLKVIETVVGEEIKAEPEQDEEDAAPLCAPGRGEFWLPTAMAIASLLILSIGYLWGAGGLFADSESVGLGWRLVGVLKLGMNTVVLTLSGLGALFVVAHMISAPLGNVKLAATRMLGIVAAISLLTFLNTDAIALEWSVEYALQAVAFAGLAMGLFSLSVRDAATLLGVTVLAVVGLLMVSQLVLWAVLP